MYCKHCDQQQQLDNSFCRCCVATTLVLYDSVLWRDKEADEDAWSMHGQAAAGIHKHLQGLAMVKCKLWEDSTLPASILNALPGLK